MLNNMMPYAVLDIETIRDFDLPAGAEPEFKPRANTKDPAKIEAQRQKFELGLDKTMALDPFFCHIVGVGGLVVRGGEREEFWFENTTGEWDDRVHLLEGAWDFVRRQFDAKRPLVTFNGYHFDLPAMNWQAAKHNVAVPFQLSEMWTRRGTATHYDLMQILAMWNPKNWYSLGFWLNYYGLGEKLGGLDGSQVLPMWREGRYEELRQYCLQDCHMTANLFERIAPWVASGPGRQIEPLPMISWAVGSIDAALDAVNA